MERFVRSLSVTRKVLTVAAIAALLLAGSGAPLHPAFAEEEPVVEAPPFSLPSLSGKTVSLSDYRGKWVFVNFWATWCGPCVIEMPALNNMFHEFKGEKFDMVAISIDDVDIKAVEKFVNDLKVDFTVLYDDKKDVQKAYGIRSVPMTFMINPNGAVVAKANGMREWDHPEMIKFLRDLMDNEKNNAKTPEPKQT